MDSKLSVPLLTPSTRYSEWKMKMISYLKRQHIYEVSIGIGKESYEYENDWLNDGDRAFETICVALSPRFYYFIDSVEYPKDIWTELDRTFEKHNEDHYGNLERTPNTTRLIYSKVSPSILFDEVVQDEEEVESSTQSIRIEESILGVSPSPAAPEVYEIYDISYYNMDDI